MLLSLCLAHTNARAHIHTVGRENEKCQHQSRKFVYFPPIFRSYFLNPGFTKSRAFHFSGDSSLQGILTLPSVDLRAQVPLGTGPLAKNQEFWVALTHVRQGWQDISMEVLLNLSLYIGLI